MLSGDLTLQGEGAQEGSKHPEAEDQGRSKLPKSQELEPSGSKEKRTIDPKGPPFQAELANTASPDAQKSTTEEVPTSASPPAKGAGPDGDDQVEEPKSEEGPAVAEVPKRSKTPENWEAEADKTDDDDDDPLALLVSAYTAEDA